MLDRISISPDETKVCFEFQREFGAYRYPGRMLYIDDFDVEAHTITNPVVIANEESRRDVTNSISMVDKGRKCGSASL